MEERNQLDAHNYAALMHELYSKKKFEDLIRVGEEAREKGMLNSKGYEKLISCYYHKYDYAMSHKLSKEAREKGMLEPDFITTQCRIIPTREKMMRS